MRDNFRRACAALIWVTLLTQYTLLLRSGEYGGVFSSALTYLGFFTIWCNILLGLAFSVPFFNPSSKLRLFFERPAVRAALALYITIVAVVYYALLYEIHNPQGLAAITNAGLHFLFPILYLIDWKLFAQKKELRYKSLPYWTLFPLAYGGYNIIRGAITGFYPYPFLDIGTRGALSVAIAMLIFTFVYVIGGAATIWIGQRLAQQENR